MRLPVRQKHKEADLLTGDTTESPISPNASNGIILKLLDLPNEILGAVIDRVDPGDLEHFAESSPLLKSLATSALEIHRERAQEYTKILLYGCHNHVGCHPVHLLEQICAKPQLTWYPTSLQVVCCGGELEEHTDEEFGSLIDDKNFDKNMATGYYDGKNDWETDAIDVYKVMKVWAEDIRERIFDSGYFDEEDSERYYNQIRKGNRQAILGLLLTLLPNLEIILLDGYTWHATLFGEIVKRITGSCRGDFSGKDRGSAQILTKMHEIGLYAHGYGETLEDFDIAGSFAHLPSMRRVYVGAPASRHVNPSNETWAQTESWSSNVDEIHVEFANLSGESILNCVRSLKTLRKFHYDRHGMWGAPDMDLRCDEMSRILVALAARFQSSLEYLCLKGSPPQGTSHIDISLKSFEKLTRVELPIQLFALIPKTQPGEPTPDKTKPLDTGARDEPEASSLSKFLRLVDILPRSMEMMEFYGFIEIQAVETMLEGLVEHKADRLPCLEKIVFQNVGREGVPDTAAMRERCSGVGIQLVLWAHRYDENN